MQVTSRYGRNKIISLNDFINCGHKLLAISAVIFWRVEELLFRLYVEVFWAKNIIGKWLEIVGISNLKMSLKALQPSRPMDTFIKLTNNALQTRRSALMAQIHNQPNYLFLASRVN